MASMLATTIDRMGLDPSFLIGGTVDGYGTNAKCGEGEHYIVEADESDGSFVHLSPYVALITNVEADHLDHYGTLDNIEKTFCQFMDLVGKDGTIIVPASDMQKMARQQLASGSKIVVVKTEKLEFYYNYGDKKRVPVRWSGRVIPEQLFYLSHVQYWPDSVTVYAPAELLDSINLVYTEPLNYANFRDTLMIECNLQKHKGVKFVPEQIKIGFYTDVLTEESVSGIPIQGINMPPGKVLRTFPSKVTVHFVAGASVFRSLKPEDFQVVAYYDELRNGSSDKSDEIDLIIYIRQSITSCIEKTLLRRHNIIIID